MPTVRYQALGPLLAGEGSRAFLGLEIPETGAARPVVLVWVPEGIAKDEELLGKLWRDTAQAVRLDHPNIIKVHGLVSLDEGIARVVEFADGESVRNLLSAAKRIPPALASLIIADAAIGVHYAHLAGKDDSTPLVHGALRPETLLVTFGGLCKVTGYGAAPLAPREVGGQRVLGRRSYTAPEQLLGGREAIDRQTDIYLLGLLLYECLTGETPVTDHDEFDRSILLRLPLPATAPGDVPPALFEVARRATAKKAVDRYPTALALRDAIEQAVGSLPSREDLAAFLRQHFPEDHPARAARRREIEMGIAEAGRTKPLLPTGEGQGKGVSPGPPPSPEDGGRLFGVDLAAEAPPTKRSRALPGVTVVLLLAVAAIGYWLFGRKEAGEPIPRDAVPVTREEAAPRTSVDAGQLQAAGPVVNEAPVRPAPSRGPAIGPSTSLGASGDVPHPVPPVQPGRSRGPGSGASGAAPVVRPAPPPSLEVLVEPPMEVAVDGRQLGKSPVEAPIAAGKHTVRVTDAEKGTSLTRTVKVAASGKTTLRLSVGKGVVEITAPDGAMVFIDGRLVGKAPVKEFEIMEGQHQILVEYEKAKWKRSFSVRPTEHLFFNVETTREP